MSINENGRDLMGAALSGLNVGPCPHPCSPPVGHPSPCGVHGACVARMDEYSCQCPLGRAGMHCEREVDFNTGDVPSFGGDSYMLFSNKDVARK